MDDPSKASENVGQIIRIAQLFVDHVCNSVQECPQYDSYYWFLVIVAVLITMVLQGYSPLAKIREREGCQQIPGYAPSFPRQPAVPAIPQPKRPHA